MLRCFEVENFAIITGHAVSYNHCGYSKKIGDHYYCVVNGVSEYGFTCADIELASEDSFEQLDLFGE